MIKHFPVVGYKIRRFASLLVNIWMYIKYKDLKFGHGTLVSPSSEFEGHNYILDHSFFKGKMGRYSYIGTDCQINACIGRYCSIADHVAVITAVHPVKDNVSTYPSFYSNTAVYTFPLKNGLNVDEHPTAENSNFSVVIGNDVYIGHGVAIMPGITIGDGVVIGANSVVTKDIEPYAIVGGSPAKLIRYRFNEKQIEQLLKLKWWNQDEDWIAEHADLFNDVNIFLSKTKM